MAEKGKDGKWIAKMGMKKGANLVLYKMAIYDFRTILYV